MNYTKNLKLPIFNDPENDKFKLDTWNQGNQNIENAVNKINTDNTNINNTFQKLDIDHSIIKEQLDNMKAKTIPILEEKINTNKTDIIANDVKINTNKTAILAAEEKINTNKINIGDLKGLNTTGKQNLVIAINEVSTKVESLSPETNTNLINEITAARQGKTKLVDNIQEIKSNITTNTNNISTNKSNITTNTNNISTLSSKVSTAEGNISTLSSKVSTAENKIEGNTTKINKLSDWKTYNLTANDAGKWIRIIQSEHQACNATITFNIRDLTNDNMGSAEIQVAANSGTNIVYKLNYCSHVGNGAISLIRILQNNWNTMYIEVYCIVACTLNIKMSSQSKGFNLIEKINGSVPSGYNIKAISLEKNIPENKPNNDTTEGYLIHPNGLIEQWGYIANVNSAWKDINLQIPYSNTSYNIQISHYWNDGWYNLTSGEIRTNKFSVSATRTDGQSGYGAAIYWRTLGW